MGDDIRVLVVEDDENVRFGVEQAVALAGFPVSAFESAAQALAEVAPGAPLVIVSDVRMPGIDGLQLLDKVMAIDSQIPVVLISGHADISTAVGAMQVGAYDFIEKPFSSDHIAGRVARAVEKRRLTLEVQGLRAALDNWQGIEALVLGKSPAIAEVRKKILRLADTSVSVLITGETGTGKELIARSLHDFGGRRDKHFVALNCGGLPEQIFESELFGHEAGAFTGAIKKRVGKIEWAHGGTLFLDEIETMPVGLQIKMLRVLQERTLERLGANESISVDCRVIAASKADLTALSADGRFRSDLLYRLNVAQIELPPLRERREDVPLLFEHFARPLWTTGARCVGVAGFGTDDARVARQRARVAERRGPLRARSHGRQSAGRGRRHDCQGRYARRPACVLRAQVDRRHAAASPRQRGGSERGARHAEEDAVSQASPVEDRCA